METHRFGVTATVFVNAADAGEAALIIERDLAGRFDSDLVSVSGHVKSGDGARCPACGSGRTRPAWPRGWAASERIFPAAGSLSQALEKVRRLGDRLTRLGTGAA